MAASAVSFVTFAKDYAGVTYPADLLRDTMAAARRDVAYPAHALWGFIDGVPDDTVEWFDPDLISVTDTLPDGRDNYILLASHDEARKGDSRFIGVNLKWLFEVRERDRRFDPPEGYELLAGETAGALEETCKK